MNRKHAGVDTDDAVNQDNWLEMSSFGGSDKSEFGDDLEAELGGSTKQLSLFSSVSMIVGMMVGSGIFASPGPILQATESSPVALLIWLMTGAISLCGALCYAELGCLITEDGGEQQYLLRAYGPLSSYLFSWFSIWIGKPASMAIMAMVFGEYLEKLFLVPADNGSVKVIVALFLITALTAVNCLSGRSGIMLQNVSTVIKLVALFLLAFSGILFAVASKPVNAAGIKYGQPSSKPGQYALALFHGFWAYDGWNNLNFVASELSNPDKNFFLAVVISIPIVMLAYFLANVAYFVALPFEQVATSTSIAVDMGNLVFGLVGRTFFIVCVAVSTLGSTNASIYTSARLTQGAARLSFLPFSTFFSGRDDSEIPTRPLILQCILANCFILTGSYSSLINLYSFTAWIFYGSAVLAVIVFRYRSPEVSLNRPFKVPLWMAVLFTLCSLALIVVSLTITEVLRVIPFTLIVFLLGMTSYHLHYRERWRSLLHCFESTKTNVPGPNYDPVVAVDTVLSA